MFQRQPFDLDAYARRVRDGPCFVCETAAGNPAYRAEHEVIYENDSAIVLLNRYPTLYGYTLVCPKGHREQATGDFTEEEFVTFQRLVYRVAEAIRQDVPSERLYILTLGSQQGNRHVHWHVAPLPPGVPPAEQQLAALDSRRGILHIPKAEMAALAARIRQRLGVGK